jgi:succinoglycan biosynthesis transport protein ExoP
MDTAPKADKATGSGEAYPYTYYGTSYSGYGSPGHGENQMQRSMQDYVLILRERAWYIALVFTLIFSAATIFTFTRTPLYQSVASVQVFRRDQVVMQVQSVGDNEIRSAEDLNTQVKVLESFAIIQRVADRLTGEDLKAFLAPYRKDSAEVPVTPAEVIFKNRKIVPVRLSLVLQVQYSHPDKFIAAKIANLFIDEYIAYNSRLRIEDSMKAVDDLKERAEQQKKKVEELAINLQAYREKNKMVSLDKGKDIVTEKLKALNAYVTQTTVPPQRGGDPLAPGPGAQGHARPPARPALHLQPVAHHPAGPAGGGAEDCHLPVARTLPRQAPQDDRGRQLARPDGARVQPRH